MGQCRFCGKSSDLLGICDDLRSLHERELGPGRSLVSVLMHDGLEEDSESILEAEHVNGPRRKQRSASNLPLWIDLQRWRLLFTLFVIFSALHESPHVLWRRRATGRIRMLQTSRGWYRGGWRKGTYQRSRERGGVACARS